MPANGKPFLRVFQFNISGPFILLKNGNRKLPESLVCIAKIFLSTLHFGSSGDVRFKTT